MWSRACLPLAAALMPWKYVAAQNIASADFFSGPTVLAIFEKDKISGMASTSIWDGDQRVLHAYGCGSKATFDELAITVSFGVDEYGNGLVTVNDKKYNTDFDPKNTGGVSCNQLFNDVHVVTECVLPVKSLPVKRDVPAFTGNSTLECYNDGLEESVFMAVSYADESDAEDPPPESRIITDEEEAAMAAGIPQEEDMESRDLEERQFFPPAPPRTSKVGDGSPHKWRRHRTLTETFECGPGVTCSVSAVKTYSVTHSANMGLAGMGQAAWINGGYSVSWTRGSSESYGCSVTKRASICVKNYRRYQGYRVKTIIGHITERGPYTIRSPLTSSGQTAYYCGVNNCRGKGFTSWEDRGKGKHGAA